MCRRFEGFWSSLIPFRFFCLTCTVADESMPRLSTGMHNGIATTRVLADSDETSALADCSRRGNWLCNVGICVQGDGDHGQCCPDGYPKYSRAGWCKKQ